MNLQQIKSKQPAVLCIFPADKILNYIPSNDVNFMAFS